MFEITDSQEQIVLAKMAKLLTKYSYRITRENSCGKNLLQCSGLSSLIDKYNECLEPHTFYKGYKNESVHYNPGLAVVEICSEIESNKKALGMFLNEFLSRITEIDEEDLESMENYLEVLGYKLETKEDFINDRKIYSLSPYIAGTLKRSEDVSYLVGMLSRHHNDLITYYDEAISTYGNIEYPSCVGNCRTLLEKFFKKLDTTNDYAKGILNSTNEQPIGGTPTPRLSITGIFEYWIQQKKGFNRYRLFNTMYSVMSGLGPHGEEVPSKEDALMCLIITEDILIWCFQNKIGC